MPTNFDGLTALDTSTIRDVVQQMDVRRAGIVLVIDDETRLVGTVTDGDLRRALLADVNFDQPITVLFALKSDSEYARPVTASENTDQDGQLSILREHRIRHLPIINDDRRLVGIVTIDDFVPTKNPALQALVMAGGIGSRMRPLTDSLPKPMLPVGDKPLMEIIVQQLKKVGIERINVSVHHESEKITDYFGDGSDFEVSINYVTEDRPLGTAGALGIMELPTETTLVVNGDILTNIDYQAMFTAHRENHAELTVAVQRQDLQLPYGVFDCEGSSIKAVTEKPVVNFLINAGIYLLEPSVYGLVPAGERYDMTDLIQRLLDEGRSVNAFPLLESWIDIGTPDEYRRAQAEVANWETQK
jgi:dTDP-glucose pyrophosphorylase/CBS domain-containing protein